MSTLPEIENVTKVLQDAQALLRQYGAIIAERALHIYYSAAVLMPDCYLSKLMSRTLKLLPAARLLTPRPLRWDRRQSSISGVTGDVANLAVSSDELYLAAVFTDGKIQLWDLVAELELAKSSYSLDILSVCFMPQSAGIICREKHRIVLREITTLEVLRIVLPHSETATSCMVTSADAQYLALGLEDGGVVLRHTLNLSEYLPPLRFHTAQISCVSFSPDGLLLASTCKNAQFAVWDTDLKYRKHAFDDDEELEAHHMSFNAASNSLAYLVCHDDEPNGMQLRIWNFESSVSEGDDFSDDESDASIVRPSLPSFHCLLHEVYGICVSLNAYNTIEICEPANSEFDATTSTLLTQGAVTSISLSPSGALLACLCGKEGTIQIFNVAHYWKPDHELNPNTRVDEAIMSPDGSQLAYSVVRDAGTRIYVEALDPHRPWKVTVSKIPQENIAFLGITNAASNDIRVVIRRDSPDSEAAVDSYGIEVYRPDKSKQSIANTFQEPPLHVLCPSYCKDLIVITEFPEDIVMNSMHIWNERSSSVMASNICTSVSMSDICIGGSLVVYCRNSDVYFRDLDTIHASEQLLYANISNARFAASALGDAFAVCWCSAQDPTLWLIQIWSHKDNTLTQIASLATSANLGQMRFARDNTNLLLAFADKTTHTIPHGVEMQAVIPSKKITFNPFIFLADDGWICYTVAGRSRLHELCWIPRQWFRHDMLDVVIRGTTIMIGGRGMCEQTIFLDTYPAIEYIETLVT
jgi:WD40 repeat protein